MGEPAEPGAPVGPEEPARAAGRRFGWLRALAVATAFGVLALSGGTWYLYHRLSGNITTDTATETQLKVHASERPAPGPTAAENILLIGSDNRGDGNEEYGDDSGTQRSDTTILLHLAADRRTATAVSIPRDLMAQVPACAKPDGGTAPARFEQFNWAFETGGAACTIRTVENMTHVRIDHHLIVDFTGFKKMVDAVGGVRVCLPAPMHDANAHIDLPAGRQLLRGEQALGYVRARYSLGDGSDTGRMERQQAFLGSLISTVRGDGVLLNPLKLYPLLNAATSSLTADPGLDSLSELYDFTQDLQRVPTGQIRFLTVPQEPYTADHNRDQLLQPAAGTLFAALRADVAVGVDAKAPADGPLSTSASPDSAEPAGVAATPPAAGVSTATTAPGTTPPSATATASGTAAPTPAPTFRGTTADRDICSQDG